MRLTDERLVHILEHAELSGMEAEMELAVRQPTIVRRSASDVTVILFYNFYPHTPVSSKWLCVVIKS